MGFSLFPQTGEAERRHRREKREREIKEVLRSIKDASKLENDPKNTPRILEFGCGDGFQISYLEELGDVVATDRQAGGVFSDQRYLLSDIQQAPFANSTFDLIFSNHVLEHLEDPSKSLDELKRIGTNDCLYAFGVPTNLWLTLSIPAQYYVLVRKAVSMFSNGGEEQESTTPKERSGFLSKLKFLLPRGHPVDKSFCKSFNELSPAYWKKVFRRSGFRIVRTHKLLTYGPSEWPLIPTNDWMAQWGLGSSILFLLKADD